MRPLMISIFAMIAATASFVGVASADIPPGPVPKRPETPTQPSPRQTGIGWETVAAGVALSAAAVSVVFLIRRARTPIVIRP
jgi:hypothetical protein